MTFRVVKLFALLWAACAFCAEGPASAQQLIGATRETAGATKPLSVGDSVFRNEVVRTGAALLAKLVFLDSTKEGT